MARIRLCLALLLLGAASACTSYQPKVEAAAPAAAAPTTTEPAPATSAPPAVELSQTPALPAEADDPRPISVASRGPAKPAAAGKPVPTGRIEIPAIGLSHATYEGIDLSILSYGPGHWPGTANPGERGNTVFPGHRTTHSRPFWDLDRLVANDDVIFTTPAGRFTYRVTQTLIVDDEAMWITTQTDDATFTIFGCHPKGSAAQRIVVKGSLVPAPTPTTTTPPTTTTAPPEGLGGLISGLLGGDG